MLVRAVVGECLQARCQELGRTVREVAQAAGVSIGHLFEVERGREEASPEVLAAICAALGMDIEDLVEAMSQVLRRWRHADAVAATCDQVKLAA